MNKKHKRGISLIVLVITIIVIIILAGAVVLSLAGNNPIESASKAAYLSDVSNFKTELELYKSKQFVDNLGVYDPTLLQADGASITENGSLDGSKTINTLIPSLGKASKYAGQFEVINGQLVFGGLDTKQRQWAADSGITVITIGEPKVTIITPAITAVTPGTDIVYTVKFSSNVALTVIDLIGKVEILDNAGVALPSQPSIAIGEITGIGTDTTIQVDITIATTSLSYGSYKLKIKSGSVTNTNDLSNTADTTSLIGFDITDNVPPTNPTMLAEPTDLTNGDVTVTITYSEDTVVKEYSTDGTTWNNYTVPIVVTTNNLSVYARGKDSSGNQNTGSTITIDNIDKIIPTVAFGTNGGNNSTQVSTTVTVSDANGINASTLQYIWDTQNTTTPGSGWTTFTNGANLTKTGDGSYYLWIKANDNLGNNVTTVSNKFIVGEIPDEIVSTIQMENKTFSGATSGYSYNNPVIPAGFVAVNTTDANWNNLSIDFDKGLIVQDASGNQFVWVPVDGTSVTYSKWTTTGVSYASTSDDTVPSGFNVTSITTTYKGFYIARYESAFDYNSGSIRVASKKSSNKTTSNWTRDSLHTGYLWNFVNYTDSKTYAENMDTSYGYNTSLVGTNLITGAQWDTTLKWIQNSGKIVTDSRTWGNHSDSTSPANVSGYASLQISGFNNNWKAKNIYDLAGNTWEWTNEIYSSNRISRGGGCDNSGSTYPAAYRSGYSAADVNNYGTVFRVALYVL